ncbi:MAG: S-adenosylhomocysteine deaminase, partial [Ruminococcaceae bacterium]|nr:S-adenosylhomocysteine deaminase [Oscillospiraceae bacterium]
MKTILKNATLLPEYGHGDRNCNLLISDGVIQNITEQNITDTADEVVDCGGNLLMPAFYNVHCHAAMTLFRGYGEDLPLQR